MICKSSGVREVEGEVKVLECLGTDVLSGVKRQRTCEGLDSEAKPPKADNKAASKGLV